MKVCVSLFEKAQAMQQNFASIACGQLQRNFVYLHEATHLA